MQVVPEGQKWARRRDLEVVPMPECPVQIPWVNQVFAALGPSVPRAWPLVFAAVSGKWVTLILKTATPPDDVESWVTALQPERLGLEGVFLNLHPSAGDRVFSSSGWARVWGSELGLTPQGLWCGPKSFQQLIPELYSDALSEAERFLSDSEGVVDLCSGVGASLLRWHVPSLGVELGEEAVRCAALNLKDHAPGATVLRGQASQRVPQIRQWIQGRSSCGLFANPPRSGLEPSVVDWVREEERIRKIAYLSCSPGTLSRDLALLQERGFEVQRVIPYDFFPQTSHIETLALVERASPGVAAALGSRRDTRSDG